MCVLNAAYRSDCVTTMIPIYILLVNSPIHCNIWKNVILLRQIKNINRNLNSSNCGFNYVVNLFVKILPISFVYIPANDTIFTKWFIQRQYSIEMIDFMLKEFRCCCVQILEIFEKNLKECLVGSATTTIDDQFYLPIVMLSIIVLKLHTNTGMSLLTYHNERKTQTVIPQSY